MQQRGRHRFQCLQRLLLQMVRLPLTLVAAGHRQRVSCCRMAVVERACLPQATLHIGECLLDVVRALRWARHPSGLALVLL